MKKIIPIKRVNKFYSFEDFDLDVEMGREGNEGDGNFTAILYRVDRQNSTTDDIYGESVKNGLKFFPPVEIYIVPTISTPENKTYNQSQGSGRYKQDGVLKFEIYNKHLEELKVDISYGDYIGYAVTETDMVFYNVTDDGIKNYDNEHTILGYKSAFRTITCAPDETFKGI